MSIVQSVAFATQLSKADTLPLDAEPHADRHDVRSVIEMHALPRTDSHAALQDPVAAASGRTNMLPSIPPSPTPASEPPPSPELLPVPELLAAPELLPAPELLVPPLLEEPAPLLLPPELTPELEAAPPDPEPPLPEALASLSSPPSEAPPVEVLEPLLHASRPTATNETIRTTFMLFLREARQARLAG